MAREGIETKAATPKLGSAEEEEEEEEEEEIEGWDEWQSDEDNSMPEFLCLFCSSRFDSTETLFNHCSSDHAFDFHGIVRDLGLNFYGSFKLINYVRSQVAEIKCWSCGLTFECSKDLQNHLHAAVSYEKGGKFLWEDDLYLKPFMADDPLLHSFAADEDDEDYNVLIDKEELMRALLSNEDFTELCNDSQKILKDSSSELDIVQNIRNKQDHAENMACHFDKMKANGILTEENLGPFHQRRKEKQLRFSIANVTAREIKDVNENYFGAYGSFGIHREMLSDKVRMDAYGGALLKNPCLMNQATVLDVGCGTGILSLFAAQAGASRVIAVEASVKMASLATQIVKDNGVLSEGTEKGDEKQCFGKIKVVQCMVEELDQHIQVPPHSIDVLVSEWMGYCLLYESMLSSVLYARDHWLKPGGAILPDTATIFGAGFGRGGTSIPFWENVYGFNMSCIGKEVVEDASHVPIIDIVDGQDIITESAVLQSFDLATMERDEMDFTASFELKLRSDFQGDSTVSTSMIWCYGIVLWFETGFTGRFCREMPTVLSTSPYSPRTHWSQTILTFCEPIVMQSDKSIPDSAASVGTKGCPAVRIRSRISIVRSSHRGIDISMETMGISLDGRKRSWPVQIFNM